MLWCDNDTLKVVASVRAIFWPRWPSPHLGARIAGIVIGEVSSICGVKHCKGLALSTTKILWVWALQGYVAMGTAEILRSWTLQGSSAVGRCKNTLRLLLVTARMFCGWALQGYLVDTPRLGTAGMLCG